MSTQKTLAELMSEHGLDLDQLVEASRLDQRIVEAIVAGRYTTSPKQRARIAAVFDTTPDRIAWSQAVGVDSMYGHGPQFGRSP